MTMMSSLFSDDSMRSQLEQELGSFNGFNLQREMDLVASDDEDHEPIFDMEEDDKQTLPEHIIKRFKSDKTAEVSLEQVTANFILLGGGGKEAVRAGGEKSQESDGRKQKQKEEEEGKVTEDNKRKLDGKKKAPPMGWGPIMAERRSTRTRGEGNMLEKAQNLQKKKNLEEPQGKKHANDLTYKKASLKNIAGDIGINFVGDDISQERIMERIVIADEARNLKSSLDCPHVLCKENRERE